MATYTVEPAAYKKVLLHAAKHPSRTVCGYLIGPKPNIPVEGDSAPTKSIVNVADAVPLFHSDPTSPMLEASALLVEELYKSRKWQIVGYYQANENYDNTNLNIVGSLIAQKIEQECNGSCVLVVDTASLGDQSKSALKLYTISKFGDDFIERGEESLQVSGGRKTYGDLGDMLRQQKETDLVDFEDHLQDVSKDFRNAWL